MPANKYALLRYRIIHRCLTNRYHLFPDKEFLRRQCEESLYGTTDGSNLSAKTIERDLRDMQGDELLGFQAPIMYSREHKGYYYGDPDYDIDRKPLSADEAEALSFAANTLYQFRDAGMFQHFAFAIEKIFEQVQLHGEAVDGPGKLVQFETVPFFRGSEYLKMLYSAIRQQLKVRFRHHKFAGGASTERILDPYLLKEYRNRWYVIGFENRKDRIQSFGLDRISDIELMNVPFTRDPVFDPDQYFAHSIGITEAGLAPETVVLSFSPVQGEYLKAQPIHQSQRVIRGHPDEYRISIEVLITYELMQLILGYGPDVKVLEPQHLRETVRGKLAATLSGYGHSAEGWNSSRK